MLRVQGEQGRCEALCCVTVREVLPRGVCEEVPPDGVRKPGLPLPTAQLCQLPCRQPIQPAASQRSGALAALPPFRAQSLGVWEAGVLSVGIVANACNSSCLWSNHFVSLTDLTLVGLGFLSRRNCASPISLLSALNLTLNILHFRGGALNHFDGVCLSCFNGSSCMRKIF